MKKVRIWILAIVLLLILGFYALNAFIYHEKQGTGDAEETADWTKSEPTSQGLTFFYPDPFSGTYVTMQEWPPVVDIVENEYACSEGVVPGTDGPAFSLEEETIGTKTYCVATSGEGAAGSTYVTKEYTTEKEGTVLRILFTYHLPQCLNYDNPEQSACTAEQKAFDPDALVDGIASRVVLP